MEQEITFYTHPSRWGNPYYDECYDYDRIAGISYGGQTIWADRSVLARENQYSPNDTEAITCELPTQLATGVSEFFYNFYVDQLRPYSSSRIAGQYDSPNCHRFGVSVYTGESHSLPSSYAFSCEFLDRRPTLSGAQGLGELAVIGSSKNQTNYFDLKEAHAAHTLLSLGSALPGKYIQTVMLGGNLALSSLRAATDYYTSYEDLRVYGSDRQPIQQPNPQLITNFNKIFRKVRAERKLT